MQFRVITLSDDTISVPIGKTTALNTNLLKKYSLGWLLYWKSF